MYSMTRIFSDEKAVTLISEGSALVHEDSTLDVKGASEYSRRCTINGRLQEPLAVKAVMEYHRNPANGGLYDRLMDQFLNNLHFDRGQAGSIGKLAEYVFTAVST